MVTHCYQPNAKAARTRREAALDALELRMFPEAAHVLADDCAAEYGALPADQGITPQQLADALAEETGD